MKARAYRYAEGRGPKPPEIEAGELINRFGVESVYGRTLTVEEMREMMTAETIVMAYRARAEAESMADWADNHPDAQTLLVEAMRAANG